MYGFILNQWILKKITEAQITILVTKGKITQIQADVILATSQI